MRRIILILILFLPTTLSAQEIHHNCGMVGDAKNATTRELNRKKDRYEAPNPADFNPQVTLQNMLAPGNDETRWSESQAAEIIRYVHDVKLGGIEICNCHAEDKLYRDTHIEIVLDPMNAGGPKRVIAGVTPRWRAMMKLKGEMGAFE